MTAPKSLTDIERKKLIEGLSGLRADQDDAVAQDPKWFLLLDAHRRALRPETLVVRGGRGAGKSALFQYLLHLGKQPLLIANVGGALGAATKWIDGYAGSLEHPPDEVVGAFGKVAEDDRRRFFWYGWLCSRLSAATGSELPVGPLREAGNDPVKLAAAAEAQLVSLNTWMDALERSTVDPVVVTYDALDRIGTLPTTRRLTASLLAMWLSLADRYRKIRPKVFVREDLFQASLSAFPDASKLDARSVSLEWRVEDLYRVLIKHMANTSDALRVWIEATSRGVPLTQNGEQGWEPPGSLPETGKASQKAFVDHLAGESMGTGTKKGLTYRWIPNRLQDAHGRAVPRSMLGLIRNAAEDALAKGPKAKNLRLLAPLELEGALKKTSLRRVNELSEESPVVVRLEGLRGRTVMLTRKDAVDGLGARPTGAMRDDEYGTDGERVLETLLELGVMSERPDGRIDIPDIYRYGFDIKRKGGVKRSR